MYFVLLYLHII